MIDWHRIHDLRDEIGADAFPEVVDLFLEEAEEVIDRLQSSGDRSGLEQDLHFLKGSALSIGFVRLAELCQAGEQMSAAGQGGDVDIAQVIDSYHNTKGVFLRELPMKISG